MANPGGAWQAATLAECVEAAQRGDQHAFTELFDRHRSFAWSVARSVTRSHAAAEEATVDGFASAFRNLPRLRQVERFPSYLAACVRNEALQAMRRQGRTAPVSHDQLDGLGLAAPEADNPEDRLSQSEEGRRAMAALGRLDDRQREAVLLVDVQGVGPAEVAASLGLSVNALHQLLHRARESLRLRFITPTISESAPPDCRACTDKIGIYLAGRASVRVVAMVDHHTADCPACRARLAEASEVNHTVRAAYGAAPVGLLGLLVARHRIGVPPTAAKARPRLVRRTGGRSDHSRRTQRRGPGGRGGAGGPRPPGGAGALRSGVALAQRLSDGVSHLMVGPLGAVPVGAVLAAASTSLTTVAALAASVPISLLPGAATSAAPATASPMSAHSAAGVAVGDGTPDPAGSTGSGDPGSSDGSAASTSTAPSTTTTGPGAGGSGSGAPGNGGTGATPSGTPALSAGVAALSAGHAGSSGSTTGSTPGGGSTHGTTSTTPATAGSTPPTTTPTSPPKFTSTGTVSFATGQPGTFTVRVSGSPTPALSEAGALPAGIVFTDQHNGTAVLGGTPGAGTAGTYSLSISATAAGRAVTQTLTLTVVSPPAITANPTAPFYSGEAGSFAIAATGSPAPSLALTGPLPPGLSFSDQGGGSAVIAGTPSASVAGSFPVTVVATNGVGPQVSLPISVVVTQPGPLEITSSPWAFCGHACSVTITASGVPAPSLSVTGLPSGLRFTDQGGGKGLISGTSSSRWWFGEPPILVTVTATSAGRTVTQQLHLYVGWY
ncbi:MAG TPA: sigma-70 family RNA polymerase sigma factor [Acidimicrobiales bacterium]